MKIAKYLSPDGDSGGNSNTNLENKLFQGFGGDKKSTDQTQTEKDEAAKLEANKTTGTDDVAKEQTTLESLLSKDVNTLTVDEKKTLDILKSKFDIQLLKDDGSEYSKEELEQKDKLDKQVKDILSKSEDKRTEEEKKFLLDNTEQESVDIYNKVDELSGIKLDIDYQGVDPKTPEGIFKREEYIREQAAAEYDNQLKQEFPIAYRLMLHLKSGGEVNEFFKDGNDENYSEVTLTKTDIKSQERIYRKSLSLKGINQDQIEALVTFAKDKQSLFQQATSELEQLKQKQIQDEESTIEEVKLKEKQEEQLADSFYKAVDNSLIKGIQGINVPKTDQQQFKKYLQDNKFFIKDGKLLFIREIDNKNLEEELAANYFKFKKANLSDIVNRKAESQNALKIKNLVSKYKITPKSSTGGETKHVPFNQV